MYRLSVTESLHTEIHRWNRAKNKTRLANTAKKNITQILTSLIVAYGTDVPTGKFILDENSIEKICIAVHTVYNQHNANTLILLSKLKELCPPSQISIENIISYVIKRLDKDLLEFYLDYLPDQCTLNYAGDYLCSYIGSGIISESVQIEPILQAVWDRGYVPTEGHFESLVCIRWMCSNYWLVYLLECFGRLQSDRASFFSTLTAECVARIFKHIVSHRMYTHPTSTDLLHCICRLNLVPDIAYICYTLLIKLYHYDDILFDCREFDCNIQAIRIICTYYPNAVTELRKYPAIMDRYVQFHDSCNIICIHLADYVLSGLDDDFSVRVTDVTLYGICWNPITQHLIWLCYQHGSVIGEEISCWLRGTRWLLEKALE